MPKTPKSPGETPEPDPDALSRQVAAQLGPLVPAMVAAGVPVPASNESLMPLVYLSDDALVVSQALSDIMRVAELYVMDREIVTVEAHTGRTESMTPIRFVTWAAEYARFYKTGKKGMTFQTMTENMARTVLACDRFRCKLKKLSGVHVVKMPCWRDTPEGNKVVALLPQGYDPETKVYTVQGGLDYAEDVPVAEARGVFRRLFGAFPFGDAEQGMGNLVSYLLTLFTRAMVDPSKVPAYVFLGNLVGSGKTVLAKVGLCTMYGGANTNTLSEPQELKKELDMAARHALPYLFFDDLAGSINNRDLNAWITGTTRAGRVIGTGDSFVGATKAMVVMTGNGLGLSPDLERRSIKVDLFAEQTVTERPDPEEPITDEWLADENNRARVLSALWALVRFAYSEEGRALEARHGKAMGSFEAWSRVVPLICVRNGFADPLVQVILPDSGDMAGADAKALMEAVIRSLGLRVGQVHTMLLPELVPIARTHGLFVEIVGTIDSVVAHLEASNGWRDQEWGDGFQARKPENDDEKREQARTWMSPDKGRERGTLTRLGYQLGPQKCSVFGRKILINRTGIRGAPDFVEEYRFGNREGARTRTFEISRLK